MEYRSGWHPPGNSHTAKQTSSQSIERLGICIQLHQRGLDALSLPEATPHYAESLAFHARSPLTSLSLHSAPRGPILYIYDRFKDQSLEAPAREAFKEAAGLNFAAP